MADTCLFLLLSKPVYNNALTEAEISRIVNATQGNNPATTTSDTAMRSARDSLWDMIRDWFYWHYDNYVEADPPVHTLDGSLVSAYVSRVDYSASEKAEEQANVLRAFPSVSAYSLPTTAFNCHSYAWHLSTTANEYWINDCTPYLGDEHTQVVEGIGTVGDICVYYDSNGRAVHSAIVISTIDGNIICRSKWGALGIYEHEYDVVPDAYKTNTLGVDCVYYKYLDHAYELYASGTSQHTLKCTICNNLANEVHSYRVTGRNATGHIVVCTVCQYTTTQRHLLNGNGVCKTCGYSGQSVIEAFPDIPRLWDPLVF